MTTRHALWLMDTYVFVIVDICTVELSELSWTSQKRVRSSMLYVRWCCSQNVPRTHLFISPWNKFHVEFCQLDNRHSPCVDYCCTLYFQVSCKNSLHPFHVFANANDVGNTIMVVVTAIKQWSSRCAFIVCVLIVVVVAWDAPWRKHVVHEMGPGYAIFIVYIL